VVDEAHLSDVSATVIALRRTQSGGRRLVPASARYGGAAVTLVALALALAAPSARAADAAQSFTSAGEHAFVVPAGVTSVSIRLVGGNGAPGSGQAPGGAGATSVAVLAVTPGETLYAEVAGNGGVGDAMGQGGYGGGGYGGAVKFLLAAPGGGGGGGASDVRTCPVAAEPAVCATVDSRLVVAGGGGGGGGDGTATPPTEIDAGMGGAADAHGFDGELVPARANDLGGLGGNAGTVSGGGAPGGNSGEPATAGKLGLGGGGGSSVGGGGGGGGGGLYGGGGGGSGTGEITGQYPALIAYNGGGGGGGGGASGVPSGATGVSSFSLLPTAFGAQPSVTITWTDPSTAGTSGTSGTPDTTGATGATGTLARPAVSDLRLSPHRFHRGKLRARLAPHASAGTIISFRLSTAAKIRITFERATLGRRIGGSCVRATPSNRRARACRRYRPVAGAVTLRVPAGVDRIQFQGVLDGNRRLTPGSYRLSLTAFNAAGAAPRAERARFKLAR
jgi:hypothetical protein